MTSIKLIVIDSNTVIRESFRRLLEGSGVVQFFGAATEDEALRAVRSNCPNAVLLNLNTKGGLELLRKIPKEVPLTRIIVYSMYSETTYVRQALKHGAKGYVSINSSADVVMEAITQVANGGYYIDPKIAAELSTEYSGDSNPMTKLTLREVEVLRHLGQNKSMQETAVALGIAYKTVANCCSIIKQKLGLQHTTDLIKFSTEHLRKHDQIDDWITKDCFYRFCKFGIANFGKNHQYFGEGYLYPEIGFDENVCRQSRPDFDSLA